MTVSVWRNHFVPKFVHIYPKFHFFLLVDIKLLELRKAVSDFFEQRAMN